MNNKIKQHCEVTLLCCLCIGFVAGSNNLKIFRNVDGTVVEVSSKIEVPSDTNLTLICEMENIKNKGNVNGYVTWVIPSEIHSDLKLRTLKNSSNLVFRNVNIKDEGLYVCASLKFKIFKTLHLLVKQSKFAKPSYLNFTRLTKRDIIPGNGPFDFNFTRPKSTDSFTELTEKLEKMREEINKQLSYDYINKVDDKNDDNYDSSFNHNSDTSFNHNYDTSFNNNEDLWKNVETVNKNFESYNNNNNNNNYDVSYNNHKDTHKNSFPVRPVALIFGVLFAVFVIFLLIRFCGYMSQNPSQTNRNNRQPNIYNPGVTVPRTNICGHTTCSGNYLLNPAGACRFHDNVLPTAPIMHNGGDIEIPLTHNTVNPTTQLDLPPTYSSSAHNSTQNLNDATIGFNKTVLGAANNDNLNLPPSYDEAIHDNSTTSDDRNESRNYGFKHGVVERGSSNN